jgi:hypothetical protein
MRPLAPVAGGADGAPAEGAASLASEHPRGATSDWTRVSGPRAHGLLAWEPRCYERFLSTDLATALRVSNTPVPFTATASNDG